MLASLARFLRDNGVHAWGYACRDASTALAEQCDRFTRFDPTTRAPIGPRTERPINDLIAQTIEACADDAGWVGLAKLGFALRASHGLHAKDTGARSWSAYLNATTRFECHRDPTGHTRVRTLHDTASVPGDPDHVSRRGDSTSAIC